MRVPVAAIVLIACTLLSSCASEEFTNASAEVAEDCRREVSLLRDTEIVASQDDLRGPTLESTPDPVEDARRAKEVSGGATVTSWPEEALMYRCLESRGVVLTEDQSEMLSEWEGELERGRPRGSRE
jgi:hypothetical protein